MNKKIAEKDFIINDLQRMIKTRTKSSDLDTRDSHNCSVIVPDELEEAIKFSFKVLNITEPIIKDKEQTYIFQNQKINFL
jgi:hypothetical protein